MSTYEKPDEEMAATVASVLAEPYHSRLAEAGVTMYVLAAFGPTSKLGDLTGPALKLHGHPALGIVKITSTKHRAAGLADFEMLLDADRWQEFDDEEREAIVDHELTHIEVMADLDGPLLDAQGRPRLSMKPHDHHLGWFDCVAARRGMKSQECQQAKYLVDEVGQFYFDLDALTTKPPAAPRKSRKLDA